MTTQDRWAMLMMTSLIIANIWMAVGEYGRSVTLLIISGYCLFQMIFSKKS